MELKKIIEAIIFISETPVNVSHLSKVIENEEPATLKQALLELQTDYDQENKAFHLIEVGGGFIFRTKPEYAFWLRKLKKEQVTRLSKAALETLAIIAYRQPIMKAEMEKIRGVEVGGILRMLMEKNLIKTVGRENLPGKPLIYGTTEKFLTTFDLKNIKDLPTIEELKFLGLDNAQASEPDSDPYREVEAGENSLFEG